MAGYVDCVSCGSPLRSGESSCPFCRASQRVSSAPPWLLATFVVSLGVGPVACDGDDMGTESDTSEVDSTTTTTTTTGNNSGTTTAPDDSSAGGSTYAGPAESDSITGGPLMAGDEELEFSVNDGHDGRFVDAEGDDQIAADDDDE
ncbi:MAG: hypothetical protein KC486_28410 [Myxococcales bacterium]|nr:hypothetical protein [Myxococcales bacterium]